MLKKRVLYVNHYAGSPEFGMEYRPYFLSKNWLAAGNEVLIVSSSYSHLRLKNPDISSLFGEQTHLGVNYCWLWGNRYSGNGIGRLINVFLFLFGLISLMYKWVKFRPDIVVASSTYPLDVPVCYLIAKLTKAKLVHEVHDLWPLTLISLYNISPNNLFIRFLAWAEEFSIRNADMIVSMLPGSDKYFVAKGLDIEKYSLIPNGFEDHVVQPAPESQVVRLKSVPGVKVVYAGYFGTANALSDLLYSAQLLEAQGISFCLLGDGPLKDDLIDQVQKMNLKNVYFFDRIKKEQVRSFLQCCDIAYIGWHKSDLYKYGISPNKLMEYMAAGLPIVHAANSQSDLVEYAGAGVVVEAGNIKAIVHGILTLASMSAVQRSTLGEKGRVYVENSLKFDKLSRQFLENVGN